MEEEYPPGSPGFVSGQRWLLSVYLAPLSMSSRIVSSEALSSQV
jgi:hypothetical protein